MKWLKRLVALGLVSCLLAGNFNSVSAAEKVSVGLKDNRPVDIIVAAGKTDYNLDNFKSDLEKALKDRGVDLSRVSISQVQSTKSSANDNFPWVVWSSSFSDSEGMGYYGIKGLEKLEQERRDGKHNYKVGLGGVNGSTYTGHDFAYNLNISLKKNEILVDGHPKQPYAAGVEYLFPPEDCVNRFKLAFTVDPTNLQPHPDMRSCFYIAGFYIYVGMYINDGDLKLNSQGVCVKDPSGRWIYSNLSNGEKHFLLEGTRSGYSLSVNGSVVHTEDRNITMDKMWFSTAFTSHSCQQHGYAKLSNVILETSSAKDLIEIIRAPDWRPDSHKFVVDINDEPREDFDESDQMSECMQRIMADNAYYISYGKENVNKAQAEKFIGKLGYSSELSYAGEWGLFSDNSSGDLDEMAEWIEYIVNKTTPGKESETIVKKREFKYLVDPAKLAMNTAVAASKYENGKWKTNYTNTYATALDPNYVFADTDEAPFWTNRYRSDFSFSTSQVGVYNITYEDTAVTPKRIIVHQLPVARFSDFNLGVNSAGRYTLQFTTDSYDPDNPKHKVNLVDEETGEKYTIQDNGIAEHVIEIRPAGLTSDPTKQKWQKLACSVLDVPGQPGKKKFNIILPIQSSSEYELKYSVIDYQGAESARLIKYIQANTDVRDIKPIASFEFPTAKFSTYEWELMTNRVENNKREVYTVIQDSSYDPMGSTLVKYEWQWLDQENNELCAPISAMPNDKANMLKVLKAAPKYEGIYYLQLVVTRLKDANDDIENTVSEAYKRVMQFTREAYSMWFTDLYNWDVIKEENGVTNITKPNYMMNEYNSQINFIAATHPADASASDIKKYSRRVAFDALKIGVKTQLPTKTYSILDRVGDETAVSAKLDRYDVEFDTEFFWPVTPSEIANGNVLIGLWGTPLKDWALVPDGVTTTGIPRYIANVVQSSQTNRVQNYFAVQQSVPWSSSLDQYSLMSVEHNEMYRFSARTPGHANAPYYIYSPTLNYRIYDWYSNTSYYYQGTSSASSGKWYYTGKGPNKVLIKVPSRFKEIELQGEGGYQFSDDGLPPVKERVANVYFRTDKTENASLPGKLGYVSRDNTTEKITIETPDKGKSKSIYFYVAPETSLIKGEVYEDQGMDTLDTYMDDNFSTTINEVEIYRMRDDISMKFNGSVIVGSSAVLNKLDYFNSDGTYKSVDLSFAMVDSNAIIRGYRINGSHDWIRINSNSTNFTFTPDRPVSTIEVLVSPEDREIQSVYTIKVEVPDTFEGTKANVTYKTSDLGTFNAVLTGNTYTFTIPESVRIGKLSIETVNPYSVVTQVNKEFFSANSVDVDYDLPYHNNPNGTFTVKPIQGASKTYSIKFVKQSTVPDVTLLNDAQLEGIYSPQGRYRSGVYTAYENITDAFTGFSGNGLPIELEIRNRETVQGVSAEVVFNGEAFPVHWDTYDGPTYRDGSEVLKGYAVISKSALSGVNGNQPITCNVYTYDYKGSDPVDRALGVAVRTIKTDSSGPSFSVTATQNPSVIKVNGITDTMVPPGEVFIEYGMSAGSGYDNSYRVETSGANSAQIRIDGVTGILRCRFSVYDVLGNVTVQEAVLDFSDVNSTNVHMEFGRNADGYYVGTRNSNNDSIGVDQFEFVS